jgi:hypothetical protein
MVAAYRRGTFGTGVVRGNGLALQQSGVVSLGAVAIPADTNFASNVLLTKTNTVNASTNTTFLDSSSNAFTITRTGSATQGSFTPYWPGGYWSGYFGTTTSDNIYAASNAAFAVGTSNFTVEFWANWTTWSGTNQRMILMGQSGLSPIEISRDSNANVLNIYTTNNAKISYTWTPTLATWYHVAVVRSGTGTNQLTLYINGTNVGTGTSADSIAANNFFVGGLNWAAGYNMQGYISNVRFVNGTAVLALASILAFSASNIPNSSSACLSLRINSATVGAFSRSISACSTLFLSSSAASASLSSSAFLASSASFSSASLDSNAKRFFNK